MLPGLDGVLLRWKPVGVVPHRVEHVEAFQAFVPRINVTGNVAQGVPDMQPRPGGIGKHVQNVEFGFVGAVGCRKSLPRRPAGLPFFLYFSEIIFHTHYRLAERKSAKVHKIRMSFFLFRGKNVRQ